MPSVLRKQITKQEHIPTFRASAAYAKIKKYIDACCNSVRSTRRSAVLFVPPKNNDGETMTATENGTTSSSPSVAVPFFAALDHLLQAIQDAVRRIPLHDMKAQRFGNKAFGDYHRWLTGEAPAMVRSIVATIPSSSFTPQDDSAQAKDPQERYDEDDSDVQELCDYLYDSFGNPTRVDYGTGHELHFFCFLMVLMDLWGIDNEARFPQDLQQQFLQQIVFRTFWHYMETMRLIQKHYSLEPAGSHGVWGLDDYHHLPFIFGAAQLCGFETASSSSSLPILPKHVVEPHHVRTHRADFFYFDNISWIFENKNGPFHEHSNVLYSVSGIDSWNKIAGGMIKMYDGEVLGKFNVIQHFLFGSHFAIAEDAAAVTLPA